MFSKGKKFILTKHGELSRLMNIICSWQALRKMFNY